MPLKIKLAPREEIVVNGVVLRNGDKRATITVVSAANVMRAKDIMFIDEADTPAKRAYLLIQTLLLSSGKDEEGITDTVTEILTELGTSVEFKGCLNNILDVASELSSCDYYKALLAMKNIISFEANLLEEQRKGKLHVDDDEFAGGVELIS